MTMYLCGQVVRLLSHFLSAIRWSIFPRNSRWAHSGASLPLACINMAFYLISTAVNYHLPLNHPLRAENWVIVFRHKRMAVAKTQFTVPDALVSLVKHWLEWAYS